jgi:hypothetical protein
MCTKQMSEQIVELKEGSETVTGPLKRVGIPVCKGPATYRLMLTWPEEHEGRIVEIPREDIESISTVPDRPRGADPAAANSD